MTTCVIMHNMIVEDERDDSIYDQGFDFQGENVEPEQQPPATFQQFVQFHREMRDWQTHVQLLDDGNVSAAPALVVLPVHRMP